MKTIVFDLEGTLTDSKNPIDDEMASLLTELLHICTVGVIGSASWPMFQKQILSAVRADAAILNRLYLLPVFGSSLYQLWSRYGWVSTYQVSPQGISKRYGVDELIKRLHLSKDDIIYVGNSIFKGGEDYCAIEMGLEYAQVKNPEDTKKWIRAFINKIN